MDWEFVTHRLTLHRHTVQCKRCSQGPAIVGNNPLLSLSTFLAVLLSLGLGIEASWNHLEASACLEACSLGLNPLMPTAVNAIWVQLYSILCQTGLSHNSNFWDLGTLTLMAERHSAQMSKNNKWQLNPGWHRMLYSCTHMATVVSKG